MPRRAEIQPRTPEPDPVHGSVLVTQLVNRLMVDGKKSIAERVVYDALAQVADKSGKSALEALESAVKSVTPVLEVKSRRVAGSNYQVPVEVNPNRRLSLSIRWLVSYARSRGDGKTMQEKFANELLDASNLRGGAVKKREDTHRMAEANKAFAHYRW